MERRVHAKAAQSNAIALGAGGEVWRHRKDELVWEGVIHHYTERLRPAADLLKQPLQVLDKFVCELADSSIVLQLQDAVTGVKGFESAHFKSIEEFSLYRTILYVAVRSTRPSLVVETGVFNGFGSAFILQALAVNGGGRLVSIDLPSRDLNLLSQGTASLPDGREPGWAIPTNLRGRHHLLLGRSEALLPRAISEFGPPDLFLHDSDHSYSHIMMEVAFAWAHMSRGLIMVDNVEQNRAFLDFAAGVSAPHALLSSYDEPSRVWQHGILSRA